jgi:hypothetical protein
MYYLKCSNCNFYNPLKVESVLFCEKCNKKLEHNFKDWQKKHLDNSFNEFVKVHCISEEDFQALNTTSGKNKKHKGKTIAIIAISIFSFLILIGVIGFYTVRKVMDHTFQTQTDKSILTENWKHTKIGISNLSLDLPFSIKKQEIKLSSQVMLMIDTTESFSNNSEKGFKVVTFYTKYKQGTEANLDGAINGAINELKNLQGATDLTWNQTSHPVGSKNGTLVSVKYKLVFYNIEVKALIVCESNQLWQVITQFSSEDIIGRKAADKILESIEIN